ncbi:MAG: hypothetical protein KJ072_07795, partial [Verrucomicrobia bacterium]|nr:hypothetical protein [Verrucomicrobiota bacterium]
MAVIGLMVVVCLAGLRLEAAIDPAGTISVPYRFDRTISRTTLENYLSRAITMEGMLNGRGDLEDNLRMLTRTGAKFVGRSLCLWGGEANLLANLERAKRLIPSVHAADPDLILQACIFEIVTTQVEQVPVPNWAFAALGLPVERRNFRYADMLYPNGRFKDHWRPGQSVPDVSQTETRLWFYYLGASFIEVGCEAIHLGQTELMNHNDRQLDHYAQVLSLIRNHAARHARRHLVLLDSHVPSGGLVRDGRLLMDFHSFPLRIKELPPPHGDLPAPLDAFPEAPQPAILEVGFSDSLYGRSRGGLTPSGWHCDHLPYLAEIDNWGASRKPGAPGLGSVWVWGYDEICWFAHQDAPCRAAWLHYAWDWVRTHDTNGYLQMPGSRTLASPAGAKHWYYANRPSPAVPEGFGDEETIRDIWATDTARRASAPFPSTALTPEPPFADPIHAVSVPAQASGYPSRAPDLDALPGFRNPPPGYGQVPFWWWTGDPLDEERLLWQLEQLHQAGISGMQVNYAHADTPGWPTYPAEPPIFSDEWWRIWGTIADACRQRGMGLGLSTYTLDWPGTENLFRQLFYSRPELNALKLVPLPRQRLTAGEVLNLPAPGDFIAARAHRVIDGAPRPGGIDLLPRIRNHEPVWTAPEGEWEIWLIRAERQPNTLNPLLPGIGEIVNRDFYQPFQDATPTRSHAGLNYFFNDELHIGAGDQVWNADFAAEFQKRKGYDLYEVLPALWTNLGAVTPKIRIDYADVRMALMEERYFQPIYAWHASRGLIFACDSGGRGLHPNEFGDYFRATRWYTAPGHDTPGGQADLIKGKVSSSVASLYRRPRVWLEGYHSLGWGATPERLMFATRENYLYGCTLLNLHGLYYTTHGSFWEWAPPCYHFRMPYWPHMGVFLKYFERLSYLMSQGTFVGDVAILYPVAPFEAGLDGSKATQTAFDTGRALMAAGVNFEFIDADSLARAQIHNNRLEVADSAYRVLIFPAMDAVRWSSLETARRFAEAGGLVLNVGNLPIASDRAGREDPHLDDLVNDTFNAERRLDKPADVPPAILGAFTPDVRAEPPVRSLHRKIGTRDVYLVMDAAPNSIVEFRARGQVELWDPWTGGVQPLRVIAPTATGTQVELPLQSYEAQIVVFNPDRPQANPPPRSTTPVEVVTLAGPWEFELEPTLDNRFGDFRLPATDPFIGPEARIFQHAVEVGDSSAWMTPDFDDGEWTRVTCDFGPQFWRLGPFPPDSSTATLDAELAKLTTVDPAKAIVVNGQSFSWRPYSFSWRQGLEGDPGHQGWHGLKENVTDHFLCLGIRTNAFNEFRYEPELEGGRYYLWTSATVDGATRARITASAPREGEKPHASTVLSPAAVYLNGERVEDPRAALELRSGVNPLLVRFDGAGRGYFVLQRDGPHPPAASRTPLSMTWHDDPSVIPFDVHAGAKPAEWFRFTAPPGLRAISVTARGQAE